MINPLLEFKEKVGPFKKASMFLQKNGMVEGKQKPYEPMIGFCPEGQNSNLSIAAYLKILNMQSEAYGMAHKTITPMLLI